MPIDSFIQVSSLTKRFIQGEKPVLDHLSFSLQERQMIGLVGSDGAGKTTLIRLMAGLLTPSEGTITIGGVDATKDSPAIHEMIGYMPERFGLYEDLTVQENLTLYADLHGLETKKRKEEFDRLLKFASLTQFVDRFAGHLSGGMKQKLGLICSLLRRPRLLLLDEPSAGIDPRSRHELWDMTKDLIKEGTTVIWSTSYLDEAEKCDHVLLLHEGHLLYTGEPKNFTSPLTGRTFELTNLTHDKRVVLTSLLEHSSIIDGTIQGRVIRVVIKKNESLPSSETFDEPNAQWRDVPPRFEDAFVEALGGSPSGFSHLATAYSPQIEGDKVMIAAEGLTKKFGDFTAVDDISFNVYQGEIFALLGPNGAGKSTTFKMLCGLIKPTSGSCTVEGVSLLQAASEARAKIGYMAQKFSLYPNMTVKQNLNFFAGVYPVPKKRVSLIMDLVIKVFDLFPFLNSPSSELPIGFKKRLSLAVAVLHQPPILFLDEPTSGVDPITRREFWNHINGLISKGITVMVTTHFMDEAEYCDRIAIISAGIVVTIGTPDELKEKVTSIEHPNPTLEEAFMILSERGTE